MFESFHWVLLLVLLNYVQIMEVHTYIWMYIAKLKCFLNLKVILSFSESVSWFFLSFPFSLCNASEGKYLFIPGTRLGFLGKRWHFMTVNCLWGAHRNSLSIEKCSPKIQVPLYWDFSWDWKMITPVKLYFIRLCSNSLVSHFKI